MSPTSAWPRCPNLQGRPLDTALLLHRDYVANFCNHIYRNRSSSGPRSTDSSVPLDAFLPLLQSTTSIGHVLANRVDGLKNGFDTFARIQQSIDRLEEQARWLQQCEGEREMMGPYLVERERATTVEVKEEFGSLNLSNADAGSSRGSMGRPSSYRTMSNRSPSRSSNTPIDPRAEGPPNANNRLVTIKIRDPRVRSELQLLSPDELEDRLVRDLGSRKVALRSVLLFDSGNVGVITAGPQGARVLRSPRLWRPRAFGGGACVQYPLT